jgi:hypothetical protein
MLSRTSESWAPQGEGVAGLLFDLVSVLQRHACSDGREGRPSVRSTFTEEGLWMVRRLSLLALVAAVAVMAGCVMPYRATIAAPVMKTSSAIAVGDTTAGTSKTGTATCEGIVFFAYGDASISAAMEQGHITRIHHVDSEEISVLGVYAKQTIKVVGD